MNYISVREFVSLIFIQIHRTTRKQITDFKISQEFSKFSKTQMAKKFFQKCSTCLIIREMQINTTLRFPFTFIKMIKSSATNCRTCW